MIERVSEVDRLTHVSQAPAILIPSGDDGLVLQRRDPVHEDALYAAIDASRAHLQTFQPWAKDLVRSDLEKTLTQRLQQMVDGTWFQYNIMLSTDNGADKVIGMVTLYDRNFESNEAKLGYWLVADATGKGYACRAAQRLVDFGFSELGLARILLEIRPENGPSEALAGRLAARVTDKQAQEKDVTGKLVTTRVWEITR